MKRYLVLAVILFSVCTAFAASDYYITASERDSDRVSIIRYTDRVVADLRRNMEQKFDQSDRELDRTAKQLEKRLDGMNEFRDALKDQNARFPEKKEVDLLVATIERRVALIESWQANWQGKMWGLGVVVTIVTFFLHIGVQTLWRDRERGTNS